MGMNGRKCPGLHPLAEDFLLLLQRPSNTPDLSQECILSVLYGRMSQVLVLEYDLSMKFE